MAWRGLTDRQWKLIQTHLPPRKPNAKGGPPLDGRSQVLRGHPVDSVDRGSLERTAQPVGELHHLLAETQGVGGEGRPAGAVARLPGAPERARQDSLG